MRMFWSQALAIITVTGILIVDIRGGEIFELYSNEGEILRNALPGNTVEFDAPLRISNKVKDSVAISLPEPSVERLFTISPNIVRPGQAFSLALRNSVESLLDIDTINITIHGAFVNKENSTSDELEMLQIYFINPPITVSNSDISLKLSLPEYFVNITEFANCEAGRTLQNLKIDNSEKVVFENYGFDIVGKYADLFQLDAVEKSADEKYLELKFSDDCGASTADETLQNRFADEARNSADAVPPLILQISTLRTPKNSAIHQSTIYLIHFIHEKPTFSADSESTSKDFSLPQAKFQSQRPIKMEIVEKSRHFSPIFRLKIYENSSDSSNSANGKEANLARNFSFSIGNFAGNEASHQIFSINPTSGVVNIENLEDLTVENLGNEVRFNATLFEDGKLLDECEVIVQIRPAKTADYKSRNVVDDGDNGEVSSFRFEQPVYAFAVGPGTKEVGRVQLRTVSPSLDQSKSSIAYAISEGGASYFLIDVNSGQISYHGPLERSAKNYTIKAIAYDNKLDLVESTSVQILVAGIGSSPPQISKKFDIVEIPEDTLPGQTIYSVRGVDFDPDARLNYRIIEWNCLSILGQPIAENLCRNSVHFGNQGHRNGSLIFSGLNSFPSSQEHNHLSVSSSESMTTAHEGSNSMNLSEFVRRKTAALASIFVNVSVTDVSHPLEPSEYASLVIRLIRSTKHTNSTRQTRRCQRKFDFGAQSVPEIQIDDSLPPNSYIYTVKVCETSIIDNEYDIGSETAEKTIERNFVVNDGFRSVKKATVVNYFLEDGDESKSKYFTIHPQQGIIRNSASLKGAGLQNITIIAKDSVSGETLDTTTLSIHCQNLMDFAPEFAEKFYEFEVSPPAGNGGKSSSKSNFVGRVSANDRNGDLLMYEIVDANGGAPNLPFAVDDQGQILSILHDDPFKQDVNFAKIVKEQYNFFIRATEPDTAKSAIIPVQIRVAKSPTAAVRPHFRFASPQKSTLMENAPVGTFVAELGALNSNRFTISVSRASDTPLTRPSRSAADKLSMMEKAERLASALTVHRPTGTVRTFAPLSGLDGMAYLFSVGAFALSSNNSTINNTLPDATIELEVDVVATSKCMPKFASNQQMIFEVIDTKPGAQIAKLSTEIEPNCEMFYEFENANNPADNFGFEIHSETGLIVVGQKGIHMGPKVDDDGYGIKRLPLIVIAKSGHVFSKLGIELRIENSDASVLLVAPTIYEKSFYFRVPENAPIGSVVGYIQAKKCKNRLGTNELSASFDEGVVEYEFDGKSSSRFFSLNFSNGEIRTAANLDVDEDDGAPFSFDLTVVAKCRIANKFEYSSTAADIHVEVVDLNDNRPHFERDDYEFSVDKNALIGTIVGSASGYDKDQMTSSLHYSLEKVTFHRKNAEKRLRDVFFEVTPSSGEIILRNSLADFSGGIFELNLRVRDALPPPTITSDIEHSNKVAVDNSILSARSSSTVVQVISAAIKIWVCTASDLVSLALAKNPLHLNSSKIDGYLQTMAKAAPSQKQPVRVLLYDSRYRIVEEEHEILRDFTVLRFIFIDVNRGEIIPPSEVDEFIRDLSLPDLKPLDQNAAQYLSANNNAVVENSEKVDDSKSIDGDGVGDERPNVGRHQKSAQTSQISALLFTAAVFAALLLTIFVALAVILCYYRRRFLRERKFLRDAQIAKAAMSSTKGGAPSTIRQFALANSASVERANHFYPPNPYITDAWENDTSKPSDNFYYSTQEMKISMR